MGRGRGRERNAAGLRCSFDFYGKLKTVTRGYGSFDYAQIDYRETDVVKVENPHQPGTGRYARLPRPPRQGPRPGAARYCEQLAEAIPRHQFKIPIQGVIGGKVIARSTIQAYRKDVTAKCYGGDRLPQAKAPRQTEERQGQNEADRPRCRYRKRHLFRCWRRDRK